MDFKTIRYELDDGILTITLNRPDQLNAFTPQMAAELIDAFHAASADDAVKAVIVTGAGRAFCAGMDLSAVGNVFGLDEQLRPTLADMHDRLQDPTIVHRVRDTGGRVTLAIFDCTKPVIAAINGAAVGIGATMTLAMDIRLASDKARIGFVFGKIGIVPEACSIVVPAAHRRHPAGARMGVHRGHLRCRGGEARRAGEGCLSRRTAAG